MMTSKPPSPSYFASLYRLLQNHQHLSNCLIPSLSHTLPLPYRIAALMGVALVSTEDYTAHSTGTDHLNVMGVPTELSDSMGVVESIYTLTPLTTTTAAYVSNSDPLNWWDSLVDTIQSMSLESGLSIGLNQGDILALCSAIVTSIYLIRLSHHSSKTEAPLQLASAMSRTEVFLAGMSLLIVCSSSLATTLGLDEVDNLLGVQQYLSHALTSPIASGQAIVILAVSVILL